MERTIFDYVIYAVDDPTLNYITNPTCEQIYGFGCEKLKQFHFHSVSEPLVVDGHGEIMCECDEIPGKTFCFLYAIAEEEDDDPDNIGWNPEENPDDIK